MEVFGKVKLVNKTIDVSDSFKKREIVVTTDEQYPQHILIEFNQDKCSILDNYLVGQTVKVSINLRGREWINPEGIAKYFNSLQGWKIEKIGDAEEVNQTEVHSPTVFDALGNEVPKDDLPF